MRKQEIEIAIPESSDFVKLHGDFGKIPKISANFIKFLCNIGVLQTISMWYYAFVSES